VLDVHKDEQMFCKKPFFSIPPSKPGRRRKPTNLQPGKPPVRLDKFAASISNQQ
jgi:hypothetical protein